MKFYSSKTRLYKTNYFNIEISLMTNPCRISIFPFKFVKALQSATVENESKLY